MASITIHDFDEALQARLRVRASVRGRSVEDEARDILVSALGGGAGDNGGLAASSRARFGAPGGVGMPGFTRLRSVGIDGELITVMTRERGPGCSGLE